MGKILYAYMVSMSAALQAFFQRLNQGFPMTLVNKCQVFYVKALNILFRKVADNLIFHTNKLRHGENKSEALLGILHSLCVHSWFIYEVQSSMAMHECQHEPPGGHSCALSEQAVHCSPNMAGG